MVLRWIASIRTYWIEVIVWYTVLHILPVPPNEALAKETQFKSLVADPVNLLA